MRVNVNDLNVDFLTASAHKFNGVKGTGFIYIKSGLTLTNMIFGGKQEHGKRGGTENVAGIVALSTALDESIAMITDGEGHRMNALAKATASGLKSGIPVIKFNGNSAQRLPGILNVTFPDAYGESMMHLLDLKGICVSTGSAWYSGKDEPSHVLLAMGLSEQQAKSAIRISYGRYNTEKDVNTIVTAICETYKKTATTKVAERRQ